MKTNVVGNRYTVCIYMIWFGKLVYLVRPLSIDSMQRSGNLYDGFPYISGRIAGFGTQTSGGNVE